MLLVSGMKELIKDLKNDLSRVSKQVKIISFIKSMDKYNEPILLTYNDSKIGEINFGYLHYGDSAIVQKLQFARQFYIAEEHC